MNINSTFQFEKVGKIQNLGNVVGFPLCYEQTDAQNGLYSNTASLKLFSQSYTLIFNLIESVDNFG